MVIYYTVQECARACDCCSQTIRRAIHGGHLSAVKRASREGGYLVTRDSLMHWHMRRKDQWFDVTDEVTRKEDVCLRVRPVELNVG